MAVLRRGCMSVLGQSPAPDKLGHDQQVSVDNSLIPGSAVHAHGSTLVQLQVVETRLFKKGCMCWDSPQPNELGQHLQTYIDKSLLPGNAVDAHRWHTCTPAGLMRQGCFRRAACAGTAPSLMSWVSTCKPVLLNNLLLETQCMVMNIPLYNCRSSRQGCFQKGCMCWDRPQPQTSWGSTWKPILARACLQKLLMWCPTAMEKVWMRSKPSCRESIHR